MSVPVLLLVLMSVPAVRTLSLPLAAAKLVLTMSLLLAVAKLALTMSILLAVAKLVWMLLLLLAAAAATAATTVWMLLLHPAFSAGHRRRSLQVRLFDSETLALSTPPLWFGDSTLFSVPAAGKFRSLQAHRELTVSAYPKSPYLTG